MIPEGNPYGVMFDVVILECHLSVFAARAKGQNTKRENHLRDKTTQSYKHVSVLNGVESLAETAVARMPRRTTSYHVMPGDIYIYIYIDREREIYR